MPFDCLVLLYPKPDSSEALETSIKTLVAEVVANNPKCQIFAPYRATNVEDGSVCFALRERFDDLQAFQEHQETAFAKEAMGRAGEFAQVRVPLVLEGLGVGKGV
jgi:quinol monooxygenase YgiN